jgi:hypothetical protein
MILEPKYKHFEGPLQNKETVPDRRRRILPEVVLVRRWVIGVPGIWRGKGLGERVGTGEVSLQAT